MIQSLKRILSFEVEKNSHHKIFFLLVKRITTNETFCFAYAMRVKLLLASNIKKGWGFCPEFSNVSLLCIIFSFLYCSWAASNNWKNLYTKIKAEIFLGIATINPSITMEFHYEKISKFFLICVERISIICIITVLCE